MMLKSLTDAQIDLDHQLKIVFFEGRFVGVVG
jgi:hypothetical protein